MWRIALILFLSIVPFQYSHGESVKTTVVDANTHKPLPNASVFGRQGKPIGICNSKGVLPYISFDDYPITVRYLGYAEQTVQHAGKDTIFMHETRTELPEFVYESKQHKVLHILAYVREYSTLTSYTDTIFLFREKMVDYMLPNDKKSRFKGWSVPRVLSSKSYYQFTNRMGLDSVSDRCNQHFSWADWVGMSPPAKIPGRIIDGTQANDTIPGKYSPTEIWAINDEHISLDVDVLADTSSRKWVPNLSNFFRNNIDFERFRLRMNYDNTGGPEVQPKFLNGYSFNIESNGRGHGMFMFNRRDEPFFVSTYAEVYITDKEYITVKEAKKWDKMQTDNSELSIYEPQEAPELQASIKELIDRVNKVDHTNIRVAMIPDKRLAGRRTVKLNLGQQVLQRLKGLLGIDNIIAKRKWNNNWNKFRKGQFQHNTGQNDE